MASAIATTALGPAAFPRRFLAGAAASRRRHGLAAIWRIVSAALVVGYVILWVQTLQEPAPSAIAETRPDFTASDLFMPWFGARALVAGRNPYTPAFASELHRAYYGVDLTGTPDVSNPAGFYYPPSIGITLAPLLWLPFPVARVVGGMELVAAIVTSVLLWLRLLGAARSARQCAVAAAAAVLFFPTISLLLLQQVTGLIVLYLVAAHAAAAKRRFAVAGVLLSLAMVKPQLSLIPGAGLLFWSLCRRTRWALPAAFVVSGAVQLVCAEALIPHWAPDFIAALRRRHETIPEFWLPGDLFAGNLAAAWIAAGSLLVLLGYLWWVHRQLALSALPALRVAALGFVVSLIVVPDVGLYNQVLLLVPISTLALAPPLAHPFGRAAVRLAMLAVLAPVVVMGVVAGLRYWPAALPFLAMPLMLVDASHRLLPLFVLPASIAACLPHRGRHAHAAIPFAGTSVPRRPMVPPAAVS